MTETELKVIERFFSPFSDKIDRLNELKKQKNITNKFEFEYHAIDTIDGEPIFQVLFDFNGGRVQNRLFLAKDYELFEARIDGIRDIFYTLK